MVRPGKASNGTAVASNPVLVARFCCTTPSTGQSPDVKQQIVAMAMHASGIRDIARVLHVSTHTVMKELKKGA